MEIKCENCKYYNGVGIEEIKKRLPKATDGSWILYGDDGECQRFPKWVGVDYNHFCGEFKASSNKKC